jgi:DNA-binding CsgD family transcriptional regulator
MPNKVVEDMRERLAAMLETSDVLQRNRSELLGQMRTTIEEMRALRGRLAATPETGDGSAVAGAARRFAEKYHLTARELEVAILLSGGASNATIASSLRISEHTARHHTRHILVKLRLHSRARAGALIARALGGAAILP